MRDAIEELVRVQLGLKKVNLLDLIVEDLGAESVDVLNIIAAAEKKYQIVIEEQEIAGIRRVADLLAAVEKRLRPDAGRAGDAT